MVRGVDSNSLCRLGLSLTLWSTCRCISVCLVD